MTRASTTILVEHESAIFGRSLWRVIGLDAISRLRHFSFSPPRSYGVAYDDARYRPGAEHS
jgi:hypothetical protein